MSWKAALNSRHIFEKFLTDVQRSINDPELTVDDTGNQILTPGGRLHEPVYSK